MGLPKSIAIFGYIYRVQLVPPEQIEDHAEADIDFNCKIIKIDENIPPERQRQRLLHEYLHGVFHYACLDAVYPHNIEEIVVDVCSKALCENADFTFIDYGIGIDILHEQ